MADLVMARLVAAAVEAEVVSEKTVSKPNRVLVVDAVVLMVEERESSPISQSLIALSSLLLMDAG